MGTQSAVVEPEAHRVFIAGATGYMGSRLVSALLSRGHAVQALVRRGSENRVPIGCEAVLGDALESASFADKLGDADTYVQLVGVANPSPSKAQQFRDIDLRSCEQSVVAAAAKVKQFVYVSVAQPAPAMQAYIEVRMRCEEIIRQTGINATILRPWYVLGPGHYWPYALKPLYAIARMIPSTREGAIRLGLVTLPQMVAALVKAVETPVNGVRIVEVPEIATARL